MTSAQRRYVMIETLISVVINTAISFGLTWLIYSGSSAITARAIIVDAVPQSFMVALMSVGIPGWLTARRLAAGRVAGLAGKAVRWPLAVRAITVALVVALAGFALHAAALAAWAPDGIGFPALLVVKMAYGGALAAIVTPWMLRYALAAGTVP